MKNIFQQFTTSYKLQATSFEKGFVALISVLIIGVLTLLISLNLLSRSIGEAYMSFDSQEAHRSLALVDSCAETALGQLKDSLTYAGNETIEIGDYSCEILPVEGTGNEDRIIKAQIITSGYAKRVKIVITQVNPTLQISSWEEVNSF